ncbi:MAG: ATP-dependent helicase [Candidatus Obscuribacterales bacterium]|nr:ATP-dependent helicase [Candidatus Obscuribacterales bacterium]
MIIDHAGSAFVKACPGAGKTRTMIERTLRVLKNSEDRRGVAFLSFTKAAVEEFQERLRQYDILPTRLFPSVISTFDSFLWQFLFAPFGIPGCDQIPRLIPDKNSWEVKPFEGAQPLKLNCFDRVTAKADPKLLAEANFDVEKRKIGPYESRARSIIENARRQGQVDFDDVRAMVQERLSDAAFAKRIGDALSARFAEIIVDEAQDCNPSDLAIVDWLRKSGMVVKLICDPNQAIYQFRGGVTDELERFSSTFEKETHLVMSGNFRSSPSICSAIVALRPPSLRENPDKPLGRFRDDQTPVHILSYTGTVSSKIGTEFQSLVNAAGIPLSSAPIVASTHLSACKAIGQPVLDRTEHLTLSLADAVMSYQFAFSTGNLRSALINLHRTILLVRQQISSPGDYNKYLVSNGLDDGSWRPEVIALANKLRFEGTDTADGWLNNARTVLGPGLAGNSTINQRLKKSQNLTDGLLTPPVSSSPAQTIHSVKGLEFPAICVVMTAQTAKRILDVFDGTSVDSSEDARKIYVGASRAQRLLAIAIPKSQSARLCELFKSTGCLIEIHQI